VILSENEIVHKWATVTGCPPKRAGKEWRGRCPIHEADGMPHRPSCDMTFTDGKAIWACRSRGCESGKINEAILGRREPSYTPPRPKAAEPPPAAAPKKTYASADDGIAALSQSHGRKPDMTWRYRNADGEHVGTVLRWSNTNGTKDILPLAKQSDGSWACAAMPEPRPLYRLPELLAAPMDTPIYFSEGEKCSDALEPLGLLAVTTAGGARSSAKTDLTPLAGRTVHIIPDHDAAGRSYADTVAAKMRSLTPPAQVFIVELDGLGESEDIVDWLGRRTDSESPETTVEILQSMAKPYPLPEPPQTKAAAAAPQSAADKRREQKAAEMAALMIGVELWHDAEGDAFATIETNGHRESWPVSSKTFARFIKGRAYAATQTAMSDDAWQDVKSALEAQAIFGGEKYETAIRICRTADAIYLDLADENWRAVRVTADGWSVVSAADCPVKFLRKRGMLPLPEPVTGGSIGELRALINVPDDDAWILVVAWLLGALKPDMPQAALAVTGEQGSAKSNMCKILRNLIDKNKSSARKSPKDDDALFIAASNGLVVCLDNLSGLQPWLSDSLCTLATGGGLAKRQLYTDGDEYILNARRPILLNGIEDTATRPDLMDRSILIHLPTIPDKSRRDENLIFSAFDEVHGLILGGLLTAVSAGLKNLSAVRLKSMPRMADFARWIVACEPALPWAPGAFMAAYSANRAAGNAAALEASAIATSIMALMANRADWQGSYSDLLDELEPLAGEKATRAKNWPANARGLSGAIDRCLPNLRSAGVTIVETGRDPVNRRKTCQITKAAVA